MSKVFIGIDPGSKGFITAIDTELGHMKHLALSDSTPHEWSEFLKTYKTADTVVCMEEVHAIYGSSAKATFSFGEIFGKLQGLIIAHGLKYHLVPPKAWQLEMWTNADKVKDGSKIDTKKTSIRAATRLFPITDFRRTPACKTIDDNKVDSTLIAEYARRKNL